MLFEKIDKEKIDQTAKFLSVLLMSLKQKNIKFFSEENLEMIEDDFPVLALDFNNGKIVYVSTSEQHINLDFKIKSILDWKQVKQIIKNIDEKNNPTLTRVEKMSDAIFDYMSGIDLSEVEEPKTLFQKLQEVSKKGHDKKVNNLKNIKFSNETILDKLIENNEGIVKYNLYIVTIKNYANSTIKTRSFLDLVDAKNYLIRMSSGIKLQQDTFELRSKDSYNVSIETKSKNKLFELLAINVNKNKLVEEITEKQEKSITNAYSCFEKMFKMSDEEWSYYVWNNMSPEIDYDKKFKPYEILRTIRIHNWTPTFAQRKAISDAYLQDKFGVTYSSIESSLTKNDKDGIQKS